MTQIPAIIETAGERIGDLVELIGGWLDNLTAAATDKFNDFMGACGQRMGELKSSVSRSLSDMRPSSISTPQAKPDITPAVERSPVISSPAFAPTPSMQAALSGVSFSFFAEDMDPNTPADLGGVGCNTGYSRAADHSMSLIR